MKKGRVGTMTCDYRCNGTTDLLAAIKVTTGEVIYDTKTHKAPPARHTSGSLNQTIPVGILTSHLRARAG